MTNVIWQAYHPIQHPDLKQDWREWLLHPHSFMQRLKAAGVQDAKVEVVEQSWQHPSTEEAHILGVQPRQLTLVREVLISSKAGKWMFARSVFPLATLTGPEQLLARLKNRALGTILFKNKNTVRSEFEVCHMQSGSDWHQHISQYTPLKNAIWARRSEFFIKHKNLLLTEVFLPDMKQLIEGR